MTSERDMDAVTRLLQASVDSRDAQSELLPLVYDHLRAIAKKRIAGERANHTLQATALVHEAYLKLVGDRNLTWAERGSFYVAASEAMRRILVDHARRKRSLKRGEAKPHLSVTMAGLAVDSDPDGILDLDEALGKLEKEDPRAAEVVRLRFFGGLAVDETAHVLGVSERTVMREWSFARARLFQLLESDPSAGES